MSQIRNKTAPGRERVRDLAQQDVLSGRRLQVVDHVDERDHVRALELRVAQIAGLDERLAPERALRAPHLAARELNAAHARTCRRRRPLARPAPRARERARLDEQRGEDRLAAAQVEQAHAVAQQPWRSSAKKIGSPPSFPRAQYFAK